MEVPASAGGGALIGIMRALSRRGASLMRAPDGTALIEQTDRKRDSKAVRPEEFMRMLDAGWLRECGGSRYAISRKGVSAVRNMLNRETSEKAVRAVPQSRAADPARTAVRERPAAAQQPGFNPRESPLAWLRQRRDASGRPMISAIEFDAGEKLRADFERSLMRPRTTASWDPTAVASGAARGAPGAGLEMSEMVVLARQRVDRALDAVGPELSGMLLDVCCFLKGLEQAESNGGWPRRAGKVVLQLGLAHLARHYGLDRGSTTRGPSIRSWGAEGYRPAMDVPGDDGPPADQDAE